MVPPVTRSNVLKAGSQNCPTTEGSANDPNNCCLGKQWGWPTSIFTSWRVPSTMQPRMLISCAEHMRGKSVRSIRACACSGCRVGVHLKRGPRLLRQKPVLMHPCPCAGLRARAGPSPRPGPMPMLSDVDCCAWAPWWMGRPGQAQWVGPLV